MADCEEEVFSCLDFFDLGGNVVDAGSHVKTEEQREQFHAVDGDWPNWEVDDDLNRNTSSNPEDPNLMDAVSELVAPFSGFFESTASDLVPTSYRYYNHGRIAVAETYTSSVSKAFDEELVTFMGFGDGEVKHYTDVPRVNYGQIPSVYQEESTTEQILFGEVQREDGDIFPTTVNDKGVPITSTLKEEKPEEKASGSESISRSMDLQPRDIPPQQENDGESTHVHSALPSSGLFHVNRKNVPDLVVGDQECHLGSECVAIDQLHNHQMNLAKDSSKEEINAKRGRSKEKSKLEINLAQTPSQRYSSEQQLKITGREDSFLGRNGSTTVEKSQIARYEERSSGAKESSTVLSKLSPDALSAVPLLAVYNESPEMTGQASSEGKVIKSATKTPTTSLQHGYGIGQKICTKQVKIADEFPKSESSGGEPYLQVHSGTASRSKAETSKSQSDVACDRGPTGTSQVKTTQIDKPDHSSWKAISTLGSESDMPDERVLIELEQFDPIAQRVDSRSCHTELEKGEIQSLAHRQIWRYGKSVDFSADSFKLLRLVAQWEDTFDIEQYGVSWRFAPLPEDTSQQNQQRQTFPDEDNDTGKDLSESEFSSKEQQNQKGIEHRKCTKEIRHKGNGRRLCKECNMVHHYRSTCSTSVAVIKKVGLWHEVIQPRKNSYDCSWQRKPAFISPDDRHRKRFVESSDYRSLGVTPFRKENLLRMDENENRVPSNARKSICFDDSGCLAGMMRERRDWSGFVGRVFCAQGEDHQSLIDEKDSKSMQHAKTNLKRR